MSYVGYLVRLKGSWVVMSRVIGARLEVIGELTVSRLTTMNLHVGKGRGEGDCCIIFFRGTPGRVILGPGLGFRVWGSGFTV